MTEFSLYPPKMQGLRENGGLCFYLQKTFNRAIMNLLNLGIIFAIIKLFFSIVVIIFKLKDFMFLVCFDFAKGKVI